VSRSARAQTHRGTRPRSSRGRCLSPSRPPPLCCARGWGRTWRRRTGRCRPAGCWPSEPQPSSACTSLGDSASKLANTQTDQLRIFSLRTPCLRLRGKLQQLPSPCNCVFVLDANATARTHCDMTGNRTVAPASASAWQQKQPSK